MRNCSKIAINLFLMLIATFYFSDAYAQERDPFSPSGTAVKVIQDAVQTVGQTVSSERSEELSPITAYKVNSYKVVGIMLSDTRKIAAIKALNGVDYVVKIGDKVGNDRGEVADIDISGVVIKNSEGEIKIPVSNKIEVNLDKTKNK